LSDGQGEFKFALNIKRDGEKLIPEVPGGGDLSIVEIETKDPDVVNHDGDLSGAGTDSTHWKADQRRRGWRQMGSRWILG
jgi:hypothetical protein